MGNDTDEYVFCRNDLHQDNIFLAIVPLPLRLRSLAADGKFFFLPLIYVFLALRCVACCSLLMQRTISFFLGFVWSYLTYLAGQALASPIPSTWGLITSSVSYLPSAPFTTGLASPPSTLIFGTVGHLGGNQPFGESRPIALAGRPWPGQWPIVHRTPSTASSCLQFVLMVAFFSRR